MLPEANMREQTPVHLVNKKKCSICSFANIPSTYFSVVTVPSLVIGNPKHLALV